MTVSLTPLVQQLRRMADDSSVESPSDVELLARFNRHQDQDAFATLMQRHGQMVLSVCRRVLGDPQSAEEAFQATFLILARKAGSLAQPASLAGWLHGVASKTARKARALRNSRRLTPLTPDLVTPAADPLAEISARELLTIVDEEIAGLPERFRLPIILCCLEGQTQDEAARRLGWSPGSIKGRLERGRTALRARLRRRGVTTPAAFIAVELSRVSATALPLPFIDSLARAACQFASHSGPLVGVSPNALLLTQLILRNWPMATLSRVLLAAVLLAGAAVGLAAWRGAGSSPPQPADVGGQKPTPTKPADTPARATDPEERVSVGGRVVDASGKPVRQAAVYLREQPVSRVSSTWNPSESRNLAQTTSDADGRFSFRDVALPPDHFGRFRPCRLDVLVQAPGHALAWRHLDAISIRRPVEVAVAPEAKVQGRLVDRNGKPLALVAVRLSEIARLDHEWIAPLGDPGYLDLHWSNAPLITRSDADGRLRLPGLPAGVRATLTVVEPGYMREDILVATTETPQPPLKLDENRRPRGSPETATVHHGDFTARVDKAFQLRAQVVFDDTGKPALGARWVEPPIYAPANRDTDAMARLALNQLAPGRFSLRVYPPANSDFLGVETPFDLKGEPRLLEPTIRLPRGVMVHGRVLDENAGKGLAAAEVEHFFDAEHGPAPHFAWRARTDAEGKFRIAVPPTKGNLVLMEVPRGYLGHENRAWQRLADAGPSFLRTFDASDNKKLPVFEFLVSRGVEVRGHAYAPDGKPVRVTRLKELDANPDRQVFWTATPAGELTLGGLRPGTRYQFAIVVPERNLGTFLDFTAPHPDAKPMPLRINLEPMASLGGRVTDEDGMPIAKAIVRLYEQRANRLQGGTGGTLIRDPLPVSPDGTFLWKDLIPGVNYSVHADADGRVHVSRLLADVAWTAEGGKVHHLPDLRLKPREE